jgi:hypothetical protein
LNATFSVDASGVKPMSYQWQKDGIDLPLQTNNTLVINSIQLTDSATYTAIISNSLGTAVSEPATLTVVPITGIETGLKAKWSLDETTGLIAYDSGPNKLNGTLYNYPPEIHNGLKVKSMAG